MERLRVYIGWTVPVGLLLRKLAYADAQAVTPFIASLVMWAAYLLIDFVVDYIGADYNQLGQQVSGKVFDPLVMDRHASPRLPRLPHLPRLPARPQRAVMPACLPPTLMPTAEVCTAGCTALCHAVPTATHHQVRLPEGAARHEQGGGAQHSADREARRGGHGHPAAPPPPPPPPPPCR